MSRILKRPMFRKGGSTSKGIMTGLVDRKKYANGIDKEELAKNVDVLEEVLREYTPKTRVPYGAFGFDIATGTPVIEETIDVTIAIPADGPSFGVAPSGTCI